MINKYVSDKKSDEILIRTQVRAAVFVKLREITCKFTTKFNTLYFLENFFVVKKCYLTYNQLNKF